MNYNPVDSFTIVRSKWSRLGILGPSKLLNDNGGRCCLGFWAKSLNCSDEQIHRKCYIFSDIDNFYDKQYNFELKGLPFTENEIRDIAIWNDSEAISQLDLENHLIEVFGAKGIKVNFVD